MPAGFNEIAHTADWELHVYAPDLPGLLQQAALGMYSLCGARPASPQRQARSLSLQAPDAESLLVAFLSELLWLADDEGLLFEHMQLTLTGFDLLAEMQAAEIAVIEKEIKAVTWHNLAIRPTPEGLEANIIFDV